MPDKAPKDWKDDNTHIYNKVAKSTIGKEKPKPMEPSLIPYEIVQKSIARFDMNPLHAYLCSIFGKEETKRLFQLYFVGTGHKWGGCTVFWQIDFNGNVRGGKLMGYNRETGHRIKKPTSQVTWAHSELKLQDFHLVQCLFGEYQLRQRPTISKYESSLVMALYSNASLKHPNPFIVRLGTLPPSYRVDASIGVRQLFFSFFMISLHFVKSPAKVIIIT